MSKLTKQAPKFGESDYQDLALIESIKRGNQAAFTILFKKYHPYVYRKICLAIRDKVEAEDIASELFQKIYENIHKYEKVYTFNAWLTKIASNYMIDCIRKRKKNISLNAISIDEPISLDSSSEDVKHQIPSMEPEAMIASESLERIAKLKVAYDAISRLPDLAIDSLPIDTEMVFRMFHEEGRTPAEISKFTGFEMVEVEDHIRKGYDKYDQGILEQKILELFYLEETKMTDIAEKVKMNINTVKVTIMRAKQKVIDSIDIRAAVIEVASTYALEQINVEKVFKVNESIV